jgi:hypothetical protein
MGVDSAATAPSIALSEKQYQAPARLGKKLSIFVNERPGLQLAHSPLLGNGPRSQEPNSSPSVGRVVESNFRLQGLFE